MKPSELQAVADVCHMLAEPTRVTIVSILSKGAKTVKALRRELKRDQPITSHHLGLLRMWGLVDRKRKRTAQIYSLNRERLEVVREFLAGLK
jgi:DNA-binding transcriptional ArsR family regulator